MNDISHVFTFWEDLTEKERASLSDAVRTERYEKGTLIHQSENGCKGVMAVTKGSLRVYCVSDEGREVTLYRVEAGDICVLSASCLMESIVFDVLIEAEDDTEVLVIPPHALHKIEEQNPRASLFVYKNATEKFSEVLWTLQSLLFMKIDQRLARYIRDEAKRKGSSIIQTTHEEIARQIGSVREVVTKTLKYLADEGAVALGRGKIEITDEQKLRRFC